MSYEKSIVRHQMAQKYGATMSKTYPDSTSKILNSILTNEVQNRENHLC